MNCPNCNALCNDAHRFCNICGAPLQSTPTERKGSHWVPILILVIMSIIGTVLFFATAGLGSSSEEAVFQVRGGALTFNERYYDGSEEVTVPEQVDGRTVYEIGGSCFAGCTEITTAILPESIQTIGSYAFENCTSLRGIFLPESVEFIGTGAFSGCADLEAIYIPCSAVYIAPDAFDGCTSLQHIFYSGTCDDWMMLYGPYMDPNVNVYCADGNYWQGTPIP